MNKILQIIKYILYIISIALFIVFIHKYGLSDDTWLAVIVTGLLLLLTLRINIGGLFKKNSFTNTISYSIITIAPLLTIILIFFRSLYDKTITNNLYPKNSIYAVSSFGIENYMAFYLIFIIILFILNIIYVIYNCKKSTK